MIPSFLAVERHLLFYSELYIIIALSCTMHLEGVTLRWLKYLRYAPEVENVRYAPDTPCTKSTFRLYAHLRKQRVAAM